MITSSGSDMFPRYLFIPDLSQLFRNCLPRRLTNIVQLFSAAQSDVAVHIVQDMSFDIKKEKIVIQKRRFGVFVFNSEIITRVNKIH